ncbi:uncharacterized protein LOC128626192 [Artibeus jamaicensis]|uniref:uncharacterized protein LOC128626192 n=1 Tax=Artibeus jamaicensis TaxID=9417 RepID=UPI00235ABF9A|nr:uncharacterized protein LOC128626192 [Artibeus jamaicensis]XP_053513403.1 uncharacterized protein LOC128626192 [Artibeus jamaicensis]XP_053513404.1 uncharacterized protein LOC128626192 [Artibeus jamaicensis]
MATHPFTQWPLPLPASSVPLWAGGLLSMHRCVAGTVRRGASACRGPAEGAPVSAGGTETTHEGSCLTCVLRGGQSSVRGRRGKLGVGQTSREVSPADCGLAEVSARSAEAAVWFPVFGTGPPGVRCCLEPRNPGTSVSFFLLSKARKTGAKLPCWTARPPRCLSQPWQTDSMSHVQSQLGGCALHGDPAASAVTRLPPFWVKKSRTMCPQVQWAGTATTSSPGSAVAALTVLCTHRQWGPLGRCCRLHRAWPTRVASAALSQMRGCGGLECSRKTREQSRGKGTRLGQRSRHWMGGREQKVGAAFRHRTVGLTPLHTAGHCWTEA